MAKQHQCEDCSLRILQVEDFGTSRPSAVCTVKLMALAQLLDTHNHLFLLGAAEESVGNQVQASIALGLVLSLAEMLLNTSTMKPSGHQRDIGIVPRTYSDFRCVGVILHSGRGWLHAPSVTAQTHNSPRDIALRNLHFRHLLQRSKVGRDARANLKI